jgi:hypothetical protein
MAVEDDMVPTYDWGKPAINYRRNRLDLRTNRMKFKNAGKSQIILEESIEHIPI